MLQAVQQVWLGKEESSHSEKAIPGHLPSWAVNLPDCQCRRWTASARWLNSGLLWGSWKHRNPSRESRAAFHLAVVQLLRHHLTGHLSHLVNFLFLFCTKPTLCLPLRNLRKFPLCILPTTKCLWHLPVTSGEAVCTTAAAVVPGDCHETAMFQKPCALSGQAALQLSGIYAVLC